MAAFPAAGHGDLRHPALVCARAIALGAPLYNEGKPEGCATVYLDAVNELRAMPAMLPPGEEAKLSAIVVQAAQLSGASRRAWVLRNALDGVIRTVSELTPLSTRSKGAAAAAASKHWSADSRGGAASSSATSSSAVDAAAADAAAAEAADAAAAATQASSSGLVNLRALRLAPRPAPKRSSSEPFCLVTSLPPDLLLKCLERLDSRGLGCVGVASHSLLVEAAAIAERRLRRGRPDLPSGPNAVPNWQRALLASERIEAAIGPPPTHAWWCEWSALRCEEVRLTKQPEIFADPSRFAAGGTMSISKLLRRYAGAPPPPPITTGSIPRHHRVPTFPWQAAFRGCSTPHGRSPRPPP